MRRRRRRPTGDTIKSNVALQKAARASERQCKRLDTENADLRWALRASDDHKERLEARHRDEIDWLNKEIARQRSFHVRASREREAMLAPLYKRIGQLRAATVRAKDLIESLRQRNARLRTEARELKAGKTTLASRVETREAQLAKLRSTRTVLSKALFGSKSERQKKPGTGRKRGQQRGAPGHGHTQRPGLGEKTERRNPPKDARVCSCCGKPYVANGERFATVIEIEVKAHTRRIVRPRWRPGLRLRVLAPGGDGAAGAAAVPRNALWDQRLGALPVRAQCLPAPAQPDRGMAGGPGAARLAGDAGRQA